MMTREEIDRMMFQQDRRWADIVTRAMQVGHPAAKRAKRFLDHDWSRTFTHWSGLARDIPVTAEGLNELLGFFHNSLYPAATAAGFPDTSFVFPDIELHDKREETYAVPSFNDSTVVSGPHGGHGGGHHGGGSHGGWRSRPGRRFSDVGYGYAYPPPWYSWPDDVVIVDVEDDAEDTYVAGSGDPWQAVLGATTTVTPREGVLKVVAPVLAPATGPITFKLDLDHRQRLTARVCVDGRCYEGTVNLGPVIREVLDKAAAFHADLHAHEANAARAAAAMPDVAAVVSGDGALASVNDAVELAGEYLVDTVVNRHIDTVSAGWWSDIKNKVKSAGRDVQRTIAKHKAAIAAIAATAAGTGATLIPGLGVVAGPLAAAAAKNMVDAASGTGDAKAAAQQALALAQQAGKQDKRVAKALATAQRAVAQTTAAYHVADTLGEASEGDEVAAAEVLKMTDAAKKGDPAAKVAMEMAHKMLDADDAQVAGEVVGHWLVPLALGIPAGALGGYFAHDKLKAFLERHDLTLASLKKPVGVSGTVDDLLRITSEARASRHRGGELSPTRAPAPAPRAPAPAHRVEATGKPILIPVVSEDGGLTDRLVMWHPTHDQIRAYGGRLPAYYTEDEGGQFLFADRHGDIVPEDGPLAGKHFKAYVPTWEVMYWGKTLSQELSDAMTQPPDTFSSGEVVGAEAALATLQTQASNIASRSNAGVIGVVRSATGHWYAPTFASSDEADDWLGSVLEHPTWFTYAAYYDKGDPTWPRPLNEGIGQKPAMVARRGAPIQRGVATTVGAEAGAGLRAVQTMARSGAAAMPGQVVGLLRRGDGTWTLRQFADADAADDWFGAATANPAGFTYVAYYDKGDPMWPEPLNEAVGRATVAHRGQTIHRGVATTV